jgi:hypothetical protein
MSATTYREYAAEHLGWMQTAKSEKEREILRQMAQAWLDAAALWDTAFPRQGSIGELREPS